ncbi:SMP-30/gluconolactonase/LRE family protein [Paraburkholderia sp. MM5384-R2]|uniref:SMP-30/gluconolactonase/LRE family protein n=1 Tax=Paraburkholderia sp. MM5384-R2 TaxID=2723097 RepID=UPI0016215406|nr:sugar lactone lactonase YvrE [Paraburkholderia sp. MM5384-R2]
MVEIPRWRQSETYPDPSVEVLDPRFLKYRITHAAVERLATGMRFGEGPVWFGGGEHGAPDGFRCDTDGNLWAGWGTGPTLNGVMVFAPDGEAIGRIALPERCANLCFGGARRATAPRVSKLHCPQMG